MIDQVKICHDRSNAAFWYFAKVLLTLIVVLLFHSLVQAQTPIQRGAIIRDYDHSKLQAMAKEFTATAHANKQEALALAVIHGWEPMKYNADGTFSELMGVRDDGSPIYYALYNVAAARSTRTDHLNTGGSLGLDLNGQGMKVYVWDGGPTLPTHQEFNDQVNPGRVIINDGITTLNGDSWHAQHVTGTILAAGVRPNAKGMAPMAQAFTHDWGNDLAEATTAAGAGMLLSNHSYGWDPTHVGSRYFGAYENTARTWDELMYNAPAYLPVFAAGNDGNYLGNDAPLNGNPAFDKLSGWQTAKNNLVVANARDANVAPDGSLINVSINPGSSQGPTDDLRIKPDITGNGTGLYSTNVTINGDLGYRNASGTSMAAPNVTGSLLLLQQHYNNLNGSFMRAATLKGLALHTADDAGMAGPDAIFGWGLLNAKAAAQEITDNGVTSIISELTLTPGQSYALPVEADGVDDLMASISWTDPPGTVFGINTLPNNSTPKLVNDLDIRVTQASSTFLPYRLTGVNTNDQGDNIVDPFERIDIPGASGIYTITVTHKGALTGGNQDYTLIVTGIAITFKVDNIEYRITGRNPNTVRAIGYEGSGGDLIIPQTVTHGDNNFNVTGIGNNAFEHNELTGVTFTTPSNVTSIGESAFAQNRLREVTLSGNVADIGLYAFADNPDLRLVTVEANDPPSLHELAFSSPSRGEMDLVVPDGTMQAYLDNGWDGFRSISYGIFTVDNIIYGITSRTEVTVLDYTGTATAVTIPETVDHGGFPYTVTVIGEAAFQGKGLASVGIPNSVTTIGERAFNDNQLTEVTLPGSVVSIGPQTFNNNPNLALVTVGANDPPVLDPIAFANANRHQIDLVVPDGTMQAYLDNGWDGFRSISYGIFTVDNITYGITSRTDVVVLGYTGTDTAVTIPETADNGGFPYTVATIGERAFNDNQLTEVTLPGSVVSIGPQAFNNNPNLALVTVGANDPPVLDPIAFANANRHQIDLVVPTGRGQTYEDNGWDGFRSIKDGIGVSIEAPAETVNLSSFTVTIRFDVEVTGFTMDDIDLVNTTADHFTGSGSTYTVEIAPTSCNGAITIDVPANVTDMPNLAATATVAVEEDPSQLVAAAKDIMVQLDTSGRVTILPGDVDGGSAYGCDGTPELGLDIDTFDCEDVGTPVTVTLTATHGTDTATATATVTVVAGGNCGRGPLADFNSGISPNGDGIGDTLVIEGLEAYGNNVVMIYDLGQRLLFRAHYGGPGDAWDGTDEDGTVPVGSYVCIIDYNEPGLGHEARMIYVNY